MGTAEPQCTPGGQRRSLATRKVKISSPDPEMEKNEVSHASGAILRQLHAWLKQIDPSFGGLVRVQNKRQEFLWVHKKFEKEY